MLTLGVDTATQWASVGLCRDGPLGEVACKRLARRQDPLLPSLQHLLEAVEVQKEELDLIAVALGPGSFTSLRVGVSLAKGLSLGLERPLVGVPSLPLFAQRVGDGRETVCVLISDRADHAYAAWFERGRMTQAPTALGLAALEARLGECAKPLVLAGPGAAAIHARLKNAKGVRLAPDAVSRPSGLEVAKRGRELFEAQGADDPNTLEPLYCAPPVARG